MHTSDLCCSSCAASSQLARTSAFRSASRGNESRLVSSLDSRLTHSLVVTRGNQRDIDRARAEKRNGKPTQHEKDGAQLGFQWKRRVFVL